MVLGLVLVVGAGWFLGATSRARSRCSRRPPSPSSAARATSARPRSRGARRSRLPHRSAAEPADGRRRRQHGRGRPRRRRRRRWGERSRATASIRATSAACRARQRGRARRPVLRASGRVHRGEEGASANRPIRSRRTSSSSSAFRAWNGTCSRMATRRYQVQVNGREVQLLAVTT